MVRFGKYPEYKKTKVSWIGDIPITWGVRRLKDIGRLFGGSGFPHEYQNVQGEELYFYKVGDLSLSENGKTLLASPHSISKETAKALRATIIPKNAIVYAKIGAALLLNRRRMTTAECCVDNNMTAFVTVAEKLTPQWAFYWLSTIDFREHVNPGAVPSLSEGYQSVLPIPVPPVDEQQTIARFLDYKTAQIDSLIAKKQALLAKLAEKRTALISHAVTKGIDPSVPMKDSGVDWLGEIPAHWLCPPLYSRYTIELGKMLNESRISGKYLVPYLRNIDVQWDAINVQDLPVMDIRPDEYSRYLVRSGDLLVCEGGEVGRAAIVNDDLGLLGYQKALHRLRRIDPERENSRFMYYTLSWAANSGLFLAEGNPNTIAHLTGEKLRRYRFPCPPVIEQKMIADWLDDQCETILKQQRKIIEVIETLQEYRSSLITHAVTGKIDVRAFVVPELAESAAHA